MIAAPKTFLLNRAVAQVETAMRTAPVDQAVSTALILKKNEVFAEKTDSFDRLIGKLRHRGHGMPISPEQLSHGTARSHPGQPLVILPTKHSSTFPTPAGR